MSKFVTITILVIGYFAISSAAHGATLGQETAQNSNEQSQILRSKLENNAFHSLKVKRLKRLLQTNKIDSEKFFGEIEKMVKRKTAE